MVEQFYTDERNVQIVIALMKAHGINKVVASPGTTNMTFVTSLQHDSYFTIYSSVDERSAAYIACGIAAESNQPVVLSCTGATASRNYMPALTEAYYRKLPILAVTSHRGNQKLGQLIDQQIDRRNIPNDIAVESVTLPIIKDADDEQFCELEANKAFLALQYRGGGPVHINLFTRYSHDFSVREIKPVKIIQRCTVTDTFPEIPKGRIGIFVGSHQPFSSSTQKAIEQFCRTYDSVVFCDHTSGYKGAYRVDYALITAQRNHTIDLQKMELLIHIGEVSGASSVGAKPKQIWRVSDDGALRDTFGKLSVVFEMSEEYFFNHYAKETTKNVTTYLDAWKKEYASVYQLIPDLPFGNIWIAKQLAPKLPKNCNFHMGIYNSLRSWNFFQIDSSINSNCNVGGFGIDGGVSTLIGSSLATPDKIHIGIFGDLAFFYDMNVIGNRHVGNNVRIILINNGRGTEFRNYGHPCYPLGDEADPYLAAAGHFGNKSINLVKHYAEDLGYKYLSASNKKEFEESAIQFLDPKIGKQPLLFEVFTETPNESEALKIILNLYKPTIVEQLSITGKHIVKQIIPQGIINTIKKKY